MTPPSNRTKPTWSEHTVVGNVRRFLSAPQLQAHTPFAEAEEPKTVIGPRPSSALARELTARLTESHRTVEPVSDRTPSAAGMPGAGRLRRLAAFLKEDFRRAPRIVRLLLPALPVLAMVTVFSDPPQDVPTQEPAPVASAGARPKVSPAAAISPQRVTVPPPLAAANVTNPKLRPGKRTQEAEAADAAARGASAEAAALYAALAKLHPEQPAFASAARILSARTGGSE